MKQYSNIANVAGKSFVLIFVKASVCVVNFDLIVFK